MQENETKKLEELNDDALEDVAGGANTLVSSAASKIRGAQVASAAAQIRGTQANSELRTVNSSVSKINGTLKTVRK